jgi:hypothetical protein
VVQDALGRNGRSLGTPTPRRRAVKPPTPRRGTFSLLFPMGIIHAERVQSEKYRRSGSCVPFMESPKSTSIPGNNSSGGQQGAHVGVHNVRRRQDPEPGEQTIESLVRVTLSSTTAR